MALTQVDSGLLSSSAQYTGFKNRIINGRMQIWQRGTSGTSVAVGAYGPDRWRVGGGNALTLTQSTIFGSPNSLLIQANGTNHAIGQRIEAKNIQDLAGQTVTLSYKIRADNPGTHILLMYYANAADDFSAEVNFVNTAKSYTSNTVTTITHTVTLPANVSNGLDIVFQWYNGGSAINITAFIWDVQLEAGSTATSFDYRPYGTELQLAQRYCPVFSMGSSATSDIYRGFAANTTLSDYSLPLPVAPRTAPTGITTSGTFGVGNGGAGANATAIVFQAGGNTTLSVRATTTAGSPTLSQGVGTALYGSVNGVIIATGCEL